MSNGEGYKTPTEDMAIGRETTREKLRRKYDIREGDVITLVIKDTENGRPAKKKTRVRVKEIHKYFVTLETQAGYLRSMLWADFEQSRV